MSASGILLDLFDFDILISLAADHFFECELVRVQVVHFDVGFLVVFLGYRNCTSRIERNRHGYDWVHCHDTRLLQQVREDVLVVCKPHVWFDGGHIAHGVSVNNFTCVFVSRLLDICVLRLLVVVILSPTTNVPLIAGLEVVEVLGELVLLSFNSLEGLGSLIGLAGEPDVQVTFRAVIATCLVCLIKQLIIFC